MVWEDTEHQRRFLLCKCRHPVEFHLNWWRWFRRRCKPLLLQNERGGQVRGPKQFTGGELAIAAKGFWAKASPQQAPCSYLTLKRQCCKIENIAAWMEAFSIFVLAMVTHFPHRWKDLLVSTPHPMHVSSLLVWLVYDQAFHENAATIRWTDWLFINVQLFNFHAAGSSVSESSLAQSNEHLKRSSKTPGSSSSVVVCISWNKGHCTASFTLCHYAHHTLGSYWPTACASHYSRDSRDDRKRLESSPGLSSCWAKDQICSYSFKSSGTCHKECACMQSHAWCDIITKIDI